MSVNLPATVQFLDQPLKIVDHDDRPWLAAADLARALGYADTSAITRIYAKHAPEFTDAMSGTVKTTVPGNRMKIPVRIFSPRGCHLVAMFARTDRAAAFRRWVLDVLETLAQPAAPAAPQRGQVEILPPLQGMITEAGKGLLAGHLLALLNRFGAIPQVVDELDRYGQLPVPHETQRQMTVLKMQTRLMARAANSLAQVADGLANRCLGVGEKPLPDRSRQALADQAIADIKRVLDIVDA